MAAEMYQLETLIDSLAFAEGPRWHGDKLWFSDMHTHWVMTVDFAGNTEKIIEVPNQPSGLGWTPNGDLLVVSMTDRKLMKMRDGALTEVADLSALAPYHCNDMVVDKKGRAYIGNFGFDIFVETPEARNTTLVLVDEHGAPRIVANDLAFPNGMVITPDDRTLIVGETMAAKLTAFDIAENGDLTNKRTWAALGTVAPDGIALDQEGAIWVASPSTQEVVRVCEDGEITDRISVETNAFACMLGGPERRHLFVLTAAESNPEIARETLTGRIEVTEVAVPGAGRP